MGFFGGIRALGQKAVNGIRGLGGKVLNGISSVGSKVGDIAGRVAGVATMINPELGATLGAVSQIAKASGGVARALRGGDVDSARQSANDASNAVASLPTPGGFVRQVKDATNSAINFH
jgi:hypothetical protein